MKHNIQKAMSLILSAPTNDDLPCPGCGKPITFKATQRGETQDMEILHPQPPCEEFKAFVHEMTDTMADLKPDHPSAVPN